MYYYKVMGAKESIFSPRTSHMFGYAKVMSSLEYESACDYLTPNGVKRRKLNKGDRIFYLYAFGDGQRWFGKDDDFSIFPDMWDVSDRGYFFGGHYICLSFRDTKKKRDYETEPMAYVPWPICQGLIES